MLRTPISKIKYLRSIIGGNTTGLFRDFSFPSLLSGRLRERIYREWKQEFEKPPESVPEKKEEEEKKPKQEKKEKKPKEDKKKKKGGGDEEAPPVPPGGGPVAYIFPSGYAPPGGVPVQWPPQPPPPAEEQPAPEATQPAPAPAPKGFTSKIMDAIGDVIS